MVNPWALPLQKPHPRVWIPGVLSKETIIWAAQKGYPYIALSTEIEATKKIWETYDKVAQENGHTGGPEFRGYLQRCHVAETEEKALANARQFMWMQGEFTGLAHPVWSSPSGYFSPSYRTAFVEYAVGRRSNPRGAAFEDQIQNQQIIAGTPKTVIPKIRRLLEETRPSIMGFWAADGFVSTADTRSCIRLLGQEVLPARARDRQGARPLEPVRSQRADEPRIPATGPTRRRGVTMANKRGTGLLMVWCDVPADKEPEFNRWYNEEHLAERLSVPGFLSAARYEAVKGGPKHLAVYELENPAVMESEAYKKVSNNPTPWTKKTGPQAVATTFIRNIYSMIHPKAVTPAVAQSTLAPALQLGRMGVPAEVDREWNEWYSTIYVPNYEKVPGVIRGRRYRAVVGEPTYLTFYEFENPKVSETDAWKAQQNAVPISATMRKHMTHAQGSPGVYVKTFER